jgi:sugar O-acyltransferase (sialic acid O-acetyltransferase NeuD family)
MNMKPDLILIGGGGHCKSCIDVIEQEKKFTIAGVVDIPERKGQSVLGYAIIASDDELSELVTRYSYFLITLGQIKTAQKRVELFELVQQFGAHLPLVISPRAYVSPHSKIGAGTIIMHHASINAGACIGNNCIINTASLVEHDAIVEDHCHISTSAVVNGGVRVRKCSFIGSNTMIREYIEIGENSVVGAGLRVMHNLPDKSFIKQ